MCGVQLKQQREVYSTKWLEEERSQISNSNCHLKKQTIKTRPKPKASKQKEGNKR